MKFSLQFEPYYPLDEILINSTIICVYSSKTHCVLACSAVTWESLVMILQLLSLSAANLQSLTLFWLRLMTVLRHCMIPRDAKLATNLSLDYLLEFNL